MKKMGRFWEEKGGEGDSRGGADCPSQWRLSDGCHQGNIDQQ